MFRTDNIGCIGAGYVGGTTMTVIASMCPSKNVYVFDISSDLINKWNNNNEPPIMEKGLKELLIKTRNNNLFFINYIKTLLDKCDIIFISVNTPTKLYGEYGVNEMIDLSFWEECARNIAKYSTRSKIIVEKSTVPINTAINLNKLLLQMRNNSDIEFVIISNPEFLAEGTAIENLVNPDRVLIGGQNDNELGKLGMNLIADIYKNWIDEERILLVNSWSSEIVKLASNAFLAQKLSSINSISRLSSLTGGQITEISKSIGMDSRIGSEFLNPSLGFGGSCFKKDILCLAYLYESFGLAKDAMYWRSVIDMNEFQKESFVNTIISQMFNNVKFKKIAILGFAFKKNTCDTRETPAVTITYKLFKEKAIVYIYDKNVHINKVKQEFDINNFTIDIHQVESDRNNTLLQKENNSDNSIQFNKINNDKLKYKQAQINSEKKIYITNELNTAVINSDAIIICTDWDEYQTLDYHEIYTVMNKPAYIFDGRNVLNHNELFKIGFNVISIGNPPLLHH